MTEDIISVKIIEASSSIIDYLPYLISILSILVSVIIVIIQYIVSIRMHRRNNNFDAKREAIQEALDFLDLCISFRQPDSAYKPISMNITDEDLTTKARSAHNKLCVTCKNKKIIELFLAIVVPDKIPYPMYQYYDEFRNECRKELGFKKIDLPKDKIYLAIVSTKPLPNTEESNHDQL